MVREIMKKMSKNPEMMKSMQKMMQAMPPQQMAKMMGRAKGFGKNQAPSCTKASG